MTNFFILSLLALLLVTVTVPITTTTTTTSVYASTGMGNCREDPEGEDCVPQKDRVGNDDDTDEDADRDGPDEDSANCWGEVTSDFTTTKDGDGGGDISHASDPVGGDGDNETPREGVGNQNEGHPSDHGDTVGPLFGSDEPCTRD